MQNRENALKEWLENSIGHPQFTLNLLAGDASFRRYFRAHYNGLSRVVMDAPLEKEPIEPFINIDILLEEKDVLSPKIFAVNKEQGFLLLEDFGDQLLLKTLTPENVDHYYQLAMNTLFKIQADPEKTQHLPPFDKDYMLKEMALFKDWFLDRYLKLSLSTSELELINQTMSWLADQIEKQPKTMIHRDYHSRNLMLVEDQLGVIDFQDAMQGPMSYDLVSLLKDCYISWPREQVLDWALRFYHQSVLAQTLSEDEFIKAFDLCGLQRHLKVLGIFSRLYLRDHKEAYLKDLPLTLSYTLECCHIYPELHPFYDFLQTRIELP